MRIKVSKEIFVYSYKNFGPDKRSVLLTTELLKVSTRYLNNCGNSKVEKSVGKVGIG